MRGVCVGLWFLGIAACGLLGCRSRASTACQYDCRRQHDECLLPASTRQAIAVCDQRASVCAASCP